MQPDNNSPFERRLDRALKSLPMRPAPRTLLPRVLAEIERRAALPWYRRTWDAWPRSVQVASLIALVLLATGLFYGGWELMLPGAVALGERLGVVFGFIETIGSAGLALLRALPGWLLLIDLKFLVVGALVLLAMIGSCLGIGTFYYRFAFARR